MAKRVKGFDAIILEKAKEEFLKNGYENASLRVIAQNASVSTSTIYTRFKDKEGLFEALVKPVAEELLECLNTYFKEFQSLDATTQEENRHDYSQKGYSGFLDILYANFDEFKLLVTSSTNGMYRKYLEEIVGLDVKCTVEFLKASKNKAFLEGRISEGFIHIISSGFYSGIFEIAVHNVKREDSSKYFDELQAFYNLGWSSYL